MVTAALVTLVVTLVATLVNDNVMPCVLGSLLGGLSVMALYAIWKHADDLSDGNVGEDK